MIHFSKYCLIAALLLTTLGCEEFLEEKPRSFINPTLFFQTEADAEAAVIAGYDFYGGFNDATYGWFRDFVYEAICDDFTCRPLGNANNVRELSFYRDFNPGNVLISSAYSNFFEGMNTFSVAVDGISGMEDFENKETLIAEAKYLRAFSYFTLVRLFGPVSIVDKSLGIDEVREIPRAASADEVYDLIISDLNAGVESLWEKPPLPGRATKWAAMSLLSMVHLTRKNWAEAAQLAIRVIEESPHELLPVYADIFSDQNENNAESIFEIQMELGDERSNQVGNWPRGVGPQEDQDFFQGPNWGGLYVATDDFIDSFEEGDRRADLISTSYTKNDGTLIEFYADGVPPRYPLKRVPQTYLEGIESNNNSSYNFIYTRLGEVYLMAAEAENEANGPGNAYQYINPIRARAGLAPLAGLSQETFRTAVRNERRHELYDERKRYFDLLRWQTLVEKTLVVRPEAQIQDFHTTWPIPQSARDRNPALEQNPGYP